MLYKSSRFFGFFFALIGVLAVSRMQAAETVTITEFMAANDGGLMDEDSEFPDWIEIHNFGTTSVNLLGWSLTDDPADLTKWTFPSTPLAPSGFVVVFASGKNRAVAGQPLHTTFSLDADGEYLALVKPDSSIASEFNFPNQFDNISYGLGQSVATTTLVRRNNAARVLVPTNGTLGLTWISNSFNATTWRAGPNGVGYEASVPGFAARNFKANVTVSSLAGAEAVISTPSQRSAVYSENRNVINYLNTGSSANYGGDNTFPGFTINNDQEDFVLEATGTITIPAAGAWTFGVNSDDGFKLTVGSFTMQCDCLRGPGDTLSTFTFATAGDYPIRLVFFERGGGAEVELFAAQGTFVGWNPTNFRLVGDTANGGLAIRSTPVGDTGYASLIGTDVGPQMYNKNASAYIRLQFFVSNPQTLSSLTLQMKYDDGFIAYLNGAEVARANAPAAAQWDSTATANRPDTLAVIYESFDVTPFVSQVVTGVNTLAIHGLNQSVSSSDFLILAELSQFISTNLTEHYFATPTPGTFNSTNYYDRVADTKFSHDRGFYDTNFSVTITSATPAVTIRYTLDGSPPTLANGFTYTAPILINRTTTLRAAAFKSGFTPSDVDTQTYIFIGDVLRQSPDGSAPGPGWPAPAPGGTGSQSYDYGMDTNIVNNPVWGPQLTNALKSIPTFSIVMRLADLFDPSTGIYHNPYQDGAAWERPGSIELIYPDGREGFQVNCGVRLRGGFSRSPDNPKHALRFFFREEYGPSKLRFPVFGPNAAQEFDKFDLRCAQNYSWSFLGDPNGTFTRDQFSRDTQLAVNGTAERGDYYHLYINGQYWGLYNSDERPEAAFGESYFGGSEENYDVVKVEAGPYTINATDGNMDAWARLWESSTNGFASDAAYQRVQGNNPDGTRNPAYEILLDAPNLIDYMLVILYGGNLDAPISAFLGNNGPNNWYGMRERSGNFGGFRFIAHDSEHTLLNVNEDRTGPFPAGDPVTGGGLPKSSPQYVWQQLQANAEFRQLVGDHVQRHFFNGGALTVEKSRARFATRSNEIFAAVVAESARWGDAKREPPLTRNDWLAAVANVWNNFLPGRSTVVLNQLRVDGLYPAIEAPVFSQMGGNVLYGYNLVISNPNASGGIYYTLDGTDPRQRGGTISPTAQSYSAPIALNSSKHVRARVSDGSTWSALVEATFYVLQDYSGLAITEIMYHPPPAGLIDGDEFEFLELKNTANNAIDLSGLSFTNGITFSFTNGTILGPGQFFVLVRNATRFRTKYPSVAVGGIYAGGLENGGERFTIAHALGGIALRMSYEDEAPWPITPDGHGFSAVPLSPNANPDPDDGRNWRGSSAIGGSPGADDPEPQYERVLISEVLTHTDSPQVDAIELYNPNATSADIGGWFLTDDRGFPKKFRVPNGTSIAPGGYHLFTESDFNATPGTLTSFSLSSMGDEVYLLAGNANTNLTGYSHGFEFGGAANGVSFGRYLNSVGDELFPAQISLTLGSSNSGPRVGPVVINEIQYHPDVGLDEFIELHNIAGAPIALYDTSHATNRWRLNGLAYTFPTNTAIPALGFLLLSSIDPASFRSKYGVPADIQIIGPYAGLLQDSGERLELQRPDTPDTNGIVPYIVVDEVRYNDKLPWPVSADGSGPSLQRLMATDFGNDPTNWFASGITPGTTNYFNAAPIATIASPQPNTTFIPPVNITITASASDSDGTIRRVEFFADGVRLGQDTIAPYSFIWTNATPGTHALAIKAVDDDSAVTISEAVSVLVFSPIPVSVFPRRSVWKYLDTGTNAGTTWRQTNFNDSAWSSGQAQLGYGDGDEVTRVEDNPTPGYNAADTDRFITTYFRRSFVITNAQRFLSLFVNVLRDDGAVVYLNGNEVFRSNMPLTPIAHSTPASGAVGGGDETSVFYGTNVSPARLFNGTNVLAVEIHQSAANSSDISFDCELTGTLGPVQPAVSITSPATNDTFTAPATIVIHADATDPDGAITRVEFSANGLSLGNDTTPPYRLDWTDVAVGNYMLRAVARNSGGLSATSAPVRISVISPSIILQNPTCVGDEFSFSFNSQSSQTYEVQYTDVLGGTWQVLTNLTGNGSSLSVTNRATMQGFYRVQRR